MMKTFIQSFLACSILSFAQIKADTYTSSAFIQSASPTIIVDKYHHSSKYLNNNDKQKQQRHPYMKAFSGKQIVGIQPSFGRQGIPLFSKKKKKDTTVGKGGKIQVKLLKHIAGTGQAGDVIMVAPAFFTNKLQKSGSAVRITDQEVKQENADRISMENEAKANALVVKKKVEEMKLSLLKKAGPDGHLFGGVGYKMILNELKKDFPLGCLDGKQVQITEVKTSDGEKLQGDIKEIGEYSVNISLLKDVSATLQLSVAEE